MHLNVLKKHCNLWVNLSNLKDFFSFSYFFTDTIKKMFKYFFLFVFITFLFAIIGTVYITVSLAFV